MLLKNVKYIGSAAAYEQCIKTSLPQVAIAGKSNVGKSSLINMLCSDGKLARVSKTPGRTRMINYFEAKSAGVVLTDLPGYGFARVSNQMQKNWGELLEGYLQNEPMLAHLFFLVDIRHEPGDGDKIMYNYIFQSNLPFTILATKADKLPKSRLAAAAQMLSSTFKVGRDDIILTSSETGAGKSAMLEKLQRVINNFNLSNIEQIDE